MHLCIYVFIGAPQLHQKQMGLVISLSLQCRGVMRDPHPTTRTAGILELLGARTPARRRDDKRHHLSLTRCSKDAQNSLCVCVCVCVGVWIGAGACVDLGLFACSVPFCVGGELRMWSKSGHQLSILSYIIVYPDTLPNCRTLLKSPTKPLTTTSLWSPIDSAKPKITKPGSGPAEPQTFDPQAPKILKCQAEAHAHSHTHTHTHEQTQPFVWNP